jgi:hypothetical protein
MNADPAKNASQFLLDLAHGKYNAELALADSALSKIGAVEPWALIVKQVLDAFVVVNRITAPIAVMPDGRGGWVPTTNSRVGPDGNPLT